MKPIWRIAVWRQFGAAIDMLDNSLRACPGELWRERLWRHEAARPDLAEFWYVAYHALFWLDLYLSGSVEGFVPPAPFGLEELDPAGLLPERAYSKDELSDYLQHCRDKCRATLDSLTGERAGELCTFGWGQASFAEVLLDNMRHVQAHAAELNLFLGQQTGSAPGWVSRTKS
jgi:integrase